MAQIEGFHYIHGSSFLHGIDERLKILLFLAFSSASAIAGPAGLSVLAITLAASLFACRINIARLASELKGFFFFITVLFVLTAYSGRGRPVAEFFIPLPSEPGIMLAIHLTCRLLVIIGAGALFIATTAVIRLTAASRSLLSKLPFVPASLVSTMMGLAVMFLPVLLDIWSETGDAVRSRSGHRIKNPVMKLVSQATPLLIRVLTRAEEIAEAMEARGYNGDYTQPEFRVSKKSLAVFICGIAVCALALCADFLLEFTHRF